MYGRIQNRELNFTIHSECDNSGRQIKIELDSEMNITGMTDGCDPFYSMALINTDRMKEASIVEIF